MGKFALRGLAQSLARELQPQNIHVAHFVIDGGIAQARRSARQPAGKPDGLLDPDAIAETYLASASPASQRLDLGDRIAPLGREFLIVWAARNLGW